MGVQLKGALGALALVLAARAEARCPPAGVATIHAPHGRQKIAEVTDVQELQHEWVQKLTTKSGSTWVFRPGDHARSEILAKSLGASTRDEQPLASARPM